MRKAMCSFGFGWREALLPKLTPSEVQVLETDNESERLRVMADFHSRGSRPALEEDSQTAEGFLKRAFAGEYLSAVVILPGGHGHVYPKSGGRIAF